MDEHQRKAAEVRAGYQLWLDKMAQLPCDCAGKETCNSCRATQALEAIGEMEAARRRKPLSKKAPKKRRKPASLRKAEQDG